MAVSYSRLSAWLCCMQIAAKMVSKIPVGPALEERDARSFRVRADIASGLGGFLFFTIVFLACIMLKWSVFNAWTLQDSIAGCTPCSLFTSHSDCSLTLDSVK